MKVTKLPCELSNMQTGSVPKGHADKNKKALPLARCPKCRRQGTENSETVHSIATGSTSLLVNHLADLPHALGDVGRCSLCRLCLEQRANSALVLSLAGHRLLGHGVFEVHGPKVATCDTLTN